MRTALVFAGLVVALGIPNYAVIGKERVLASGTPVLVELAPVDPRSLMQGDYMRLDYAITRELSSRADWPRDGHIVVRLDGSGVATFIRRHVEGTPLSAGELLLQYRKRGNRVRVGPNAFFFQEGHAQRYQGARYGELRVGADGEAVLVGLRDANLRPLGSVEALQD